MGVTYVAPFLLPIISFAVFENNKEDDDFAKAAHLLANLESFLKIKCYHIIVIGGIFMQKIMIIDDEIDILHLLERYFRLNGYSVITAEGAEEALSKLCQQPDLILLDINMPGMDGISFCKSIRDYVTCPILFLTANTNDKDKVKGFSVGGDDYIVKPFSVEELGARVSAHLRRENRNKTKSQVLFDLHFIIDYSQRAVFYKNKEIPLTRKEFDIVEVLSQNPGQVFDKERLYEAAWGLDGLGNNSVIAEHISQIRAKLTAVGARQYIETVWGVGYKWAK